MKCRLQEGFAVTGVQNEYREQAFEEASFQNYVRGKMSVEAGNSFSISNGQLTVEEKLLTM